MPSTNSLVVSFAVAAQLLLSPAQVKADVYRDRPSDLSVFTAANMDACLVQLALQPRGLTADDVNRTLSRAGQPVDSTLPPIIWETGSTDKVGCMKSYLAKSCTFDNKGAGYFAEAKISENSIGFMFNNHRGDIVNADLDRKGAVLNLNITYNGFRGFKHYGAKTPLDDIKELAPIDRTFIDGFIKYSRKGCDPALS